LCNTGHHGAGEQQTRPGCGHKEPIGRKQEEQARKLAEGDPIQKQRCGQQPVLAQQRLPLIEDDEESDGINQPQTSLEYQSWKPVVWRSLKWPDQDARYRRSSHPLFTLPVVFAACRHAVGGRPYCYQEVSSVADTPRYFGISTSKRSVRSRRASPPVLTDQPPHVLRTIDVDSRFRRSFPA